MNNTTLVEVPTSPAAETLTLQRSQQTEHSGRVLVVAEPEHFQIALNTLLAAEGFDTMAARNGFEALAVLDSYDPTVILVDGSLPDMGLGEACLRLRSATGATMVALTGNGREDHRLVALAAGADTHLTKPFSSTELVEAIADTANLPKTAALDNPQLTASLSIDRLAREVLSNDKPVHLTRTEFDLLATLASRPDMVFSRKVLIDRIWPEFAGDDRVLSVHMANLRRKIDGETTHIRTVRGVGYRFQEDNLPI